MRIGLNATCLNERPSGARQRFVGIYRALVKQMPESEFVVYDPSDAAPSSWLGTAPNVSRRRTPVPSQGRLKKLVAGAGYWPVALRLDGPQVFEVFNLPLVRSPIGRTILTIHDIRGARPDSGLLERTLFERVLRRSILRADHVVTVSETMKAELLAFEPRARVSALYNGLDQADFDAVTEGELQLTREKYKLPSEFILAVGHFERRKNYRRLVEALGLIRTRCPPLVIVGNESGDRAAIAARASELGLSARVHLLSGLSDLEVRCMYKLCSLFVFPSTYEGFGIPLLEAMAARQPMVVSNLAVFKEITAGRGHYFNPTEPTEIAEAIAQVLASETERARLVAVAHARVGDFSYEKIALGVRHLYRDIT